MSGKKPLSPVKPQAMDIILYYPCPFCERMVPLLAPTQPSVAVCDGCRNEFPVMPTDEVTLKFLRTVLRNGQATIDPNYL